MKISYFKNLKSNWRNKNLIDIRRIILYELVKFLYLK